MRLIAIVLLGSLLSGCAFLSDRLGTSILQGGLSLTADVANPVTPERLNQIEQAGTVALTGLVTYRRLCIAGKIPSRCYDDIKIIQAYTKPLCTVSVNGVCTEGVIPQLRKFVINNDQVNAIKLFNEARQLISHIMHMREVANVDAVIGAK